MPGSLSNIMMIVGYSNPSKLSAIFKVIKCEIVLKMFSSVSRAFNFLAVSKSKHGRL